MMLQARNPWRNLAVWALNFLIILFSFYSAPAHAAPDRQIIIRDTEIETMIKNWAKPVIEAAELNPDNINIILVQNDDVNAFVAGGPNIFIYTGLLMKSDNAAEVVGVIAHELGHIRGGHLVRVRGAYEHASYESLIGTLLGIGAAVLTGNGGVGTAIAMGSQSMVQRKFLSFTRVQESSADQAALSYLDGAHMNPDGLVSFMKKLEGQELVPASQQDEYVRTHPLTHNRVEALEAVQARSAYEGRKNPPGWADQHARMIAKLKGFIHPERVAWDYSDQDNSLPALYARAIAAYRENHVDEALSLADRLLQAEIDNPFFLELKGQMLMDFGRVEDSLPPYKKALEIYPKAPLIDVAYAHALIETAKGADDPRLSEAVTHLKRALQAEPRMGRIHRFLAIAYGKMGETALADLHLAEEALLNGKLLYARQLATRAANALPENAAAWLRAQDILQAVSQQGRLDKKAGKDKDKGD